MRCTVLFLFYFLSGAHVTATSSVDLTTSGEPLCPGKIVNLTCTIEGSQPILTWTSDEYIGEGVTSMQFAPFDNIGDTHTIPRPMNPNFTTIATLVNNTNETGVHVLVSQLSITTSADISTASVMCENNEGTTSTATIEVLAPPGVPTIDNVCKRKGTNGRCHQNNYYLVSISWSIPSNITDSDLYYYVMTIDNESHYHPNLLYPEPTVPIDHCITPASTISIHAVDRCRNEGPKKLIDIHPVHLKPDCDPPTDYETKGSSHNIAVAVVLAALVFCVIN